MCKKIINKFFIVCAIILCLCLVGCGGSGSGTGGQNKGEYDEKRYTFISQHTYTTTFNASDAKEALAKANANLAKEKSFSYTISMFGENDEQHEYEGITKIDLTGASPLASIELLGDLEFAFYIANNKAYLNQDGSKIAFDVEGDLSNLINKVQGAIGSFTQFDENMINDSSFVSGGVDEYNVTVIKFNYEEAKEVTVVIYQDKIMKVLYTNEDLIEYTANYNYEPVTVELPSDLDEYVTE